MGQYSWRQHDGPSRASASGSRPAQSLPRSQTRILRHSLSDPSPITARLRPLQLLWIFLDLLSFGLSALFTAWLLERYPSNAAWGLIGIMATIRVLAFIKLGMYRAVLRYSGLHTLSTAAAGLAIGSSVALTTTLMLGLGNSAGLGRSFWVLEGLISLVLACGMRLSVRLAMERRLNQDPQSRRVLIYGAGQLGELTLRNLVRDANYRPIGFIDDAAALSGRIIHGKPVLGDLEALQLILQQQRADLLVVAMSNPDSSLMRRVFHLGMNHGLHVLVAKGVTDPRSGAAGLGLRDINLEELLSRPSRQLDPGPVRALVQGRTVLVTGAGGSIGSEICRQVAGFGCRHLHLLDHSEFNLYAIEGELLEHFPQQTITTHLISICDAPALDAAFASARPDLVLHAAAYKHVPMVEANPFAGLRNNVSGFRHVLASAAAHGCANVVLISTDKAVSPTNVMGASKRVCELLLHTAAPAVRCCAVRFGNVLGSSGSVIPRFTAQIEAGGPVTVTHPEITRYFMLIPEAVALVLQAAARSSTDPEIFILDMGEPVKIVDLARQLIFMAGKQPGVDIDIVFSGLRPGEKLYEELLIDPSNCRTDVPGITIAPAVGHNAQAIIQLVSALLAACEAGDRSALRHHLSALVPEWVPSTAFHPAPASEPIAQVATSP